MLGGTSGSAQPRPRGPLRRSYAHLARSGCEALSDLCETFGRAGAPASPCAAFALMSRFVHPCAWFANLRAAVVQTGGFASPCAASRPAPGTGFARFAVVAACAPIVTFRTIDFAHYTKPPPPPPLHQIESANTEQLAMVQLLCISPSLPHSSRSRQKVALECANAIHM